MKGLAEFLSLIPPTKRLPQDTLTGGKYGYRHDSADPKGEGWLGNIGTNENPITEYSIDIDGRQMPTVTPNQGTGNLFSLANSASRGTKLHDDVIKKAIEWDAARKKAGYSPFKD